MNCNTPWIIKFLNANGLWWLIHITNTYLSIVTFLLSNLSLVCESACYFITYIYTNVYVCVLRYKVLWVQLCLQTWLKPVKKWRWEIVWNPPIPTHHISSQPLWIEFLFFRAFPHDNLVTNYYELNLSISDNWWFELIILQHVVWRKVHWTETTV